MMTFDSPSEAVSIAGAGECWSNWDDLAVVLMSEVEVQGGEAAVAANFHSLRQHTRDKSNSANILDHAENLHIGYLYLFGSQYHILGKG